MLTVTHAAHAAATHAAICHSLICRLRVNTSLYMILQRQCSSICIQCMNAVRTVLADATIPRSQFTYNYLVNQSEYSFFLGSLLAYWQCSMTTGAFLRWSVICICSVLPATCVCLGRFFCIHSALPYGLVECFSCLTPGRSAHLVSCLVSVVVRWCDALMDC